MSRQPKDLGHTVQQSIGLAMPKDMNPDMFGVEIEVEGRNLMTRNNEATKEFWTITNDGSLRTLHDGDMAFEYKFNRPLTLDETTKALRALHARLTQPTVELFNSPRASVHVHVNFAVETMRTLYNFITLAYMLEEVLVDLNGKHRIGNNFCLRAKDAEGILITLVNSMRHHYNIWDINTDQRYSATNLASLLRFGTIEFRSLEFTVDPNRIMDWVNVIQAMKVKARAAENPTEIVMDLSRLGPRRFLLETLGPLLGYRYTQVPNFEVKLMNGMQLVQEFAYCVNWGRKADDVSMPQKKGKAMYQMDGYQERFADNNPAMEVPVPTVDDLITAEIRDANMRQWATEIRRQDEMATNPFLAPAQPPQRAARVAPPRPLRNRPAPDGRLRVDPGPRPRQRDEF